MKFCLFCILLLQIDFFLFGCILTQNLENAQNQGYTVYESIIKLLIVSTLTVVSSTETFQVDCIGHLLLEISPIKKRVWSAL